MLICFQRDYCLERRPYLGCAFCPMAGISVRDSHRWGRAPSVPEGALCVEVWPVGGWWFAGVLVRIVRGVGPLVAVPVILWLWPRGVLRCHLSWSVLGLWCSLVAGWLGAVHGVFLGGWVLGLAGACFVCWSCCRVGWPVGIWMVFF